MAHKEIAFADPKDVDIVVPGSPDNILNIMRNYPLSWERAGNGPYFAPGSGLLIGLAAERGTVYPDYGNKDDTAKWPALYIEGNDITKAGFGRADNARAQKALAAASAGPMLVSQGDILDIPARIREGGYTGFTASDKRPQRAVGITASGEVADGIWESADLYEVAEDMIEAGCVEVMKWDGGGSTATAEFDHKTGKPVLAWGWASRALPAAIVFRKVKRVWRPSDGKGRLSELVKPRVYLSPSNQKHNIGLGDYGSEQFRMRRLAWIVGKYLELQGADVAISRSDQEISEVVADSDKFKPVFHISLHSNAGGGSGTEGFYWPGSARGSNLTHDICHALALLNPNGFRRVKPNGSLAEIAGPDAVCSYIEIGFHDNREEAAWIICDTEMIALTIAKVICRHLELPEPDDWEYLVRIMEAEQKLAEIRRIVS